MHRTGDRFDSASWNAGHQRQIKDQSAQQAFVDGGDLAIIRSMKSYAHPQIPIGAKEDTADVCACRYEQGRIPEGRESFSVVVRTC